MQTHPPFQVAERITAGFHVRVIWQRGGGDVLIEIADQLTGEIHELNLPPARAMDAFRRPLAYVSSAREGVVAPDGAGAPGAASGVRRAA